MLLLLVKEVLLLVRGPLVLLLVLVVLGILVGDVHQGVDAVTVALCVRRIDDTV